MFRYRPEIWRPPVKRGYRFLMKDLHWLLKTESLFPSAFQNLYAGALTFEFQEGRMNHRMPDIL